MEHIAIDLGGRESQVCVRGADGAILQEHRCPTRGLAKYLEGRPASRVIVETCSESFAVADAAARLGHEVRVVPAAGALAGSRIAPYEDGPARRADLERGFLPDRPSVGAHPGDGVAPTQDDVRDAGSPGGRSDEDDRHGARLASRARDRMPFGGTSTRRTSTSSYLRKSTVTSLGALAFPETSTARTPTFRLPTRSSAPRSKSWQRPPPSDTVTLGRPVASA